MLAVRDLRVSLGGLAILRGVSLEAPAGRITGLVGPNGSGKTTLMDAVSGVVIPESGGASLDGRPVPSGRPAEVAALGIGRTFQVPRLARRLTVLENLLVAARGHPGERLGPILARPGRVAGAERDLRVRARGLVERLALQPVADSLAGHLSGGQQKLLAIGMVLMNDPRALLLDEPAAGVSPVLVARQVALLRALRDEGRIVLLIEHNMELVSDACDQVIVLHGGQVIARGTPGEIRRDAAVVRSYLGGVVTASEPSRGPAP